MYPQYTVVSSFDDTRYSGLGRSPYSTFRHLWRLLSSNCVTRTKGEDNIILYPRHTIKNYNIIAKHLISYGFSTLSLRFLSIYPTAESRQVLHSNRLSSTPPPLPVFHTTPFEAGCLLYRTLVWRGIILYITL